MRKKLVKVSIEEYEKVVKAKELLKRKGTEYLSMKTSVPIEIEHFDLGEIIRIGADITIHFLEEP